MQADTLLYHTVCRVAGYLVMSAGHLQTPPVIGTQDLISNRRERDVPEAEGTMGHDQTESGRVLSVVWWGSLAAEHPATARVAVSRDARLRLREV